MNQEFKIGDKVIIADMNKIDNGPHHPFGVNESMKTMSGMQATIIDVIPSFYTPSMYSHCNNLDSALYRIDIDYGEWAWANIMFKPCIGNLKIVEEDL